MTSPKTGHHEQKGMPMKIHALGRTLVILTLLLQSCTWDDSLYNSYVHNDTITPCPPHVQTDEQGNVYFQLTTLKCYENTIQYDETCQRGVSECDIDLCPTCSLDFTQCQHYQDLFDLYTDTSTDVRYIGALINPSIDLETESDPDKRIGAFYDFPELVDHSVRTCPKDYPTCFYRIDTSSNVREKLGCMKACDNNNIICGDNCIDPKTDSQNCGGCNNHCVDILNDACANEDPSCQNSVFQSDVACDAGVCVARTCADGFHRKSSSYIDPVSNQTVPTTICEPDSHTICGDSLANCNDIEGVDTGQCVNGKCQAVSCSSGFHLNSENTCVINTPETCGNGNNDCNASVCKHLDNLTQTQRQQCQGICNVSTCMASACPDGTHFSQDKAFCELDTPESCGAHNVKCNFQNGSGKCDYELIDDDDKHHTQVFCKYTLCYDGFHLFNNSCEPDSISACGPERTLCDVQNATNFCTNGICSFECVPGYHKANNQCVKNTNDACGSDNCSTKYPNGTGLCDFNTCYLASCNTGYHINPNTNTCDADTTNRCGSISKSCIVTNGQGECLDGKCILKSCDSGYHLNNGACIEDSTSSCGKTGNKCVFTNGSGTCNDGICTYTKCNTNYHLDGNACVKDSINACGSTTKQCNIAHANNTCSKGKCEFTCIEGYHKNGQNECIENTSSNCDGKDCTTAFTNGSGICVLNTCTLSSCDAGYHKYSGQCEKDSKSNCGAHGNSCAVSNGTAACSNGACTIQSCNTGYHLYNGNCEADSNTNCGAHGNSCSVSNGTAACSNGACTVKSCDDDYHKDGYACIKDSISACGSTSKQCNVANAINTCTNKTCAFTCIDGYYKNNKNQCVKNTDTNCAGKNCTTAFEHGTGICTLNTCTLSSCNTGYHKNGTQCEVDSLEHCGAHNQQCSFDNGSGKCANGACILTACNGNYHFYDGGCELNSDDNCGKHDHKCNGNKKCNVSTGVCQ